MTRANATFRFLAQLEGLPVAAVLVILFASYYVAAPTVFSGPLIYMSFLQTIPPQLVLALGLTFVITAGEIDLSFPAVVALSGFVFTWIFKNVQMPGAVWLGFVLALAVGALVGYLNGILVARIGVPSIMATLASQFFWYGVTILVAGGLQINIAAINNELIHTIFVGRLFGIIPVQALWATGLAVFLWFILNRHKFGEAIMFIGDNANVARVMGINVEATRIRLFTMMGVIAAFSGLLLTMEINVFFPNQGQGFLLPVMAAVFVGGTSIAGGQGSIVGTFFGAYIIGSLEAGVVASGIGGYWTQAVEGLVMAASVVVNIVIGEKRIGALTNRLRQWAIPGRVAPASASPEKDATRMT